MQESNENHYLNNSNNKFNYEVFPFNEMRVPNLFEEGVRNLSEKNLRATRLNHRKLIKDEDYMCHAELHKHVQPKNKTENQFGMLDDTFDKSTS